MKQDIQDLVAKYGAKDPLTLADPSRLPLAVPSFGGAEIEEAIASLLTGWITMGKKVAQFEQLWAQEVGTKYAVAVNSGSSALLVMLCALVECGYLQPKQEVLLPAVGWSTSMFSVIQAGLTPVLVDIDPHSLCIEGVRERPVLAIHLLGCPSRVQTPLLLEDACGAHGAQIAGKKVGGLGKCGAFSFFFSHHLTTGEGGMITTSDENLYQACRSIRAHGWVRDRSDRQKFIADHPKIDERFLFVSQGYNLRMTDIAGAFGIHQVGRLDEFVARRRRNHLNWCERIQSLSLPLNVFPEIQGTKHSGFAFPILLHEDTKLSRKELCSFLESRNIQTRPISGSNLSKQPIFAQIPGFVEGETPVADAIHERGFFVGQSHAFGEVHGELLTNALQDAFSARK